VLRDPDTEPLPDYVAPAQQEVQIDSDLISVQRHTTVGTEYLALGQALQEPELSERRQDVAQEPKSRWCRDRCGIHDLPNHANSAAKTGDIAVRQAFRCCLNPAESS
jgi:hypothetical protein